MTKEGLEKEAEEYLKKKNYTSGYIGYFASGYCKQAYIDSAEPREKRIAELEQQVEKMKSALIDIKTNTDDVNIEWQIKYLLDELGVKENGI